MWCFFLNSFSTGSWESHHTVKIRFLNHHRQGGWDRSKVRRGLGWSLWKANLENLKPVSYSDVAVMLTEDGGGPYPYVGRPTCYYCRQNFRFWRISIPWLMVIFITIQIQISWTVSLVKILFDKLEIPGTCVIRLKMVNCLWQCPDA